MTSPQKRWSCFAMEQLFVNPRGEILACCLARVPFARAGEELSGVLERKVHNNEDIYLRNDAKDCWNECPVRHPSSDALDPARVTKLVVDTSTFCPLRCSYCSLTYAFGRPEWERGTCGPEAHNPNDKWSQKDARGQWVAPVATKANDVPSFVAMLKNLVPAAKARGLEWVELTGGDSAYHPEFVAALEYLQSASVKTIYLSSGLVPPGVMPAVRQGVFSGNLFVTVSADATTPETWAAVKLRPKEQFERVSTLLSKLAQFQPHNQIAVKFIVMRENVHEAARLIPYYAALGIDKFVVSEYRAQPTHFVDGPSEDEMRFACAEILRSFAGTPLRERAELIIVGLERFFAGRSVITRAEIDASLRRCATVA